MPPHDVGRQIGVRAVFLNLDEPQIAASSSLSVIGFPISSTSSPGLALASRSAFARLPILLRVGVQSGRAVLRGSG